MPSSGGDPRGWWWVDQFNCALQLVLVLRNAALERLRSWICAWEGWPTSSAAFPGHCTMQPMYGAIVLSTAYEPVP
jgi:hypothetical protein